MEKRRWGDRRDARLVRDIDSMHAYMAYFMPKRTDAEVYLNQEVDVTELLKFLSEKNGPGAAYKTTIFHAAICGIAKIVYMRPLLNRYISGKRFFMRDKITLAFNAKKKFTDEAGEALMILRAEGSYTISDITRKIVGDVGEARNAEDTEADDILNILQKLPRLLMSLFILCYRILDYFGKMPAMITDLDYNYATILLSNLGSIKCDAPYHHLNNTGTNSIVITLGEMHKAQRVDRDGNVSIRDVMNIGMTVDERIADGFYFAKCIKMLEYMFAKPYLLDRPLNEEFQYEQ